MYRSLRGRSQWLFQRPSQARFLLSKLNPGKATSDSPCSAGRRSGERTGDPDGRYLLNLFGPVFMHKLKRFMEGTLRPIAARNGSAPAFLQAVVPASFRLVSPSL